MSTPSIAKTRVSSRLLNPLNTVGKYPVLKEFRLPAGDFTGFDIDYPGYSGSGRLKVNSSSWKAQGFKGVRLIGAGPRKTNIVPEQGLSDSNGGATINIGLSAGIVQLEGVTIYPGPQMSIRVGNATVGPYAQPRPIEPCTLILDNFFLSGEKRSSFTGRTKWGIFSYQSDLYLKNGVIDTGEFSEHSQYAHGLGRHGIVWDAITVLSAGAEPFKVRSDPSEVLPTKSAALVINNSSITNWYQPHSARGGAGIVLQGAEADVYIKDTLVLGDLEDHNRARCFLVDDNGDKGRLQEYATGHIFIDNSAFIGVMPDYFGDILRVGTIRTDNVSKKLAKSFNMTNSGSFGDNTLLRLLGVDTVSLQGNNTSEIVQKLESLGFGLHTETDFTINGGPLIPLSQNFIS